MTPEQTENSLYALSVQEGTPGVLHFKTVAFMLELRDERIRDLAEFQRAVLMERRTRRKGGQ